MPLPTVATPVSVHVNHPPEALQAVQVMTPKGREPLRPQI
jgi:hypothetical protein